jgi:hypothetical protein
VKIVQTLNESKKSVGVWDETRRFNLFESGCDGIEGRGLDGLKKDFIVIGGIGGEIGRRERVVCCGRRGGAKSREFFEVRIGGGRREREG